MLAPFECPGRKFGVPHPDTAVPRPIARRLEWPRGSTRKRPRTQWANPLLLLVIVSAASGNPLICLGFPKRARILI
jgi:hypothetical protein